MTIKFSEKEQTFYDGSLDYAGLPDDLVDVTSEQHSALLDKLNSGYYIKSDLSTSADPRPNEYAAYSTDKNKWLTSDAGNAKVLEEAKAAAVARVSQARDAAAYNNITYNGVEYQADATAQLRITGAVASQQASFDWIAADNNVQTLSLAELSGLGQLIMTRLSAIVAQAAQDKATVNGYTALADAENFTADYSAIAAQFDTAAD